MIEENTFTMKHVAMLLWAVFLFVSYFATIFVRWITSPFNIQETWYNLSLVLLDEFYRSGALISLDFFIAMTILYMYYH